MKRTVPALPAAIGCVLAFGLVPGAAQDLDAGKSPARLFSGNCTACHRGPQGLGAGKDPRAVAAFLTQHYTSSRASASALAGYLAGLGGDPQAARARTRAEPPTEPQTAARTPQVPQPAAPGTPARGETPVVQAPQPAAPGSTAVPTRPAVDPDAARAALAREVQKRRERREAELEAQRRVAQPARFGLPSVSSDPRPPIVSLAPVPVPQGTAGDLPRATRRSAEALAPDGMPGLPATPARSRGTSAAEARSGGGRHPPPPETTGSVR